VLIPEGLIEFVPEMNKLIKELNDLMADFAEEFSKITSFIDQEYWLDRHLSNESSDLLKSLPPEIGRQLLADRDPHGNVQVSKVETEKLLIGMVEKKLAELKKIGAYTGKFSALAHFFGYEGRCAFPSNFDADYCYSLGFTAFLLIASGLTGYISSVRNLVAPADQWIPGGIPLTMMMNMERRHGSPKPVIKKALVELDGKPFSVFSKAREEWAVKTLYHFPGAIQYYGPCDVCDQPTKTLKLEHS
jgi:pyrophosphate--fructose-6-phosphate 1-phosphotransferase